ncbi:Zn(II)2Cys6 transcription factor [Candidatus Bathyarchaeota archaeon]|nr:Zn(II)2Cys6 transcription factor [Candidatus Bathyarchaeota archaeon]
MEGGPAEQPGQLGRSPGDRRRGAPPALPGVGAASPVPQAGTSASTPRSPYGPRSTGQKTPAGIVLRRRRNRHIAACLECRSRKLGCSKTNPCDNCVKFSRECVYLSSQLEEATQLRLNEIKEKVGSLERSLERDVAKSGSSRVAGHQGFVVDEVEYETFENLDHWPSDAVATDVAYDDGNVEGAEILLDIGVKVGRMRMTDRVGGLSRPRLSEEVSKTSRTLVAFTVVCTLKHTALLAQCGYLSFALTAPLAALYQPGGLD